MSESTYTARIGGWEFEYRLVHWVIPFFTVLLRVTFGFYFLWTGMDKLFSDFTAKGFLLNATQGPLKDIFRDIGESSTAVNIVDPLVVYGQILIGVALILGLFTRFALFMAALQMFLFYLAALWPEFNPFLDEHIFYLLIFALLGALGSGRMLGVDAIVEQWEPVSRVPALQYALG